MKKQNEQPFKIGDEVRLKKDKTQTFPRPTSIVIGFLNSHPVDPLENPDRQVDLDARLDGVYIHPVDHLERAEV